MAQILPDLLPLLDDLEVLENILVSVRMLLERVLKGDQRLVGGVGNHSA